YVVDKLEVGKISNPMQFKTDEDKDAYRILYLKERTHPHRANMTDDYDRLQNWALDYKKNEVIKKWMTEKISTTFVRINPEYRDCHFVQKWIK
ncbi:MAG: peptidylprolyl isomerase, partial [Bacteroidetes bacterium HGW-Bacteroidetes-22]